MSNTPRKQNPEETIEIKGVAYDETATPKGHASKTGVLACRMPQDEIKIVERAATEAGETVSEFVRKAIFLRIEGTAGFQPTINVSIGNPYMQVDNLVSWSRASTMVQPDSYPHSIQANL